MNNKTGPIEVLIIDDDREDIDLTREILCELEVSLKITGIESGEEALKYLYKRDHYKNSPTPDLILLDLNMPKINGLELLQTIKHDTALKKIPVVILTTSEDEDDIARCYITGANSFITKPVDVKEFQKIIESIDSVWFTVFKRPPNHKP